MTAEGQVQLGVVLLCHDQLEMATRMARIWAEGGAQVVVHVDARASQQGHDAMVQGLADLQQVSFSPRRACHWGRFDLVQATLDATAQLLAQSPEISHVYLASGSCLPLRPIAELRDYIASDPRRDHIESVAVEDVFWAMGGLNEERFTRFFPFDWRHRRWLFDQALKLQRRLHIHRRLPAGMVPHLGSQWWCLTRTTLEAILNDPRRAEYDRFFRLTWIPDEAYFQTLARLHSDRIESRSLTLARFDHNGRPYLLYDDHQQMLEESGCFVARKIWPGTRKLFHHFPHPSTEGREDRLPDPSRIERLFNRATALRTLGRPGLYSQSRFPKANTDHRKSAVPYAVMVGFDELIPGFETWLAGQVDADVHGHLFSPEEAQFAGRAEFGPGALSTNPRLRDYNPQAFLTSLVRVTGRMQVFQHGPQDSDGIDWFIATDANARVLVITGAWIVPLYLSDMPFEEIRNAASVLQRAEIEQFKILNSPWLRAQVHVWDMAEFAARPDAIMTTALGHLEPGRPVPTAPLPPLHDLSGMGAFLQRLRNAGLRPALTGHFPMTDTPIKKGRAR